jgi:gliding motility-associated protein GldE
LYSQLDSGDPLSGWVLLTTVLSTSLILYPCLLLVLLFLSALISGAEASFFSLSTEEQAQIRANPGRLQKRIIYLLDKPKLLLATILVCNYVLYISIIVIATYFTWALIDSRDDTGTAITFLILLITFTIVFFGEILPRVYVHQRKFFFIRSTAFLLHLASYIFSPLAWMLIGIGNLIDKRTKQRKYKISVEDLNYALEITSGTESTEEDKDILRGIMNFGHISARQIMQFRMDITAFSLDMDFHELMDKINKSGYSRVPIYKETIDKIEGILYIKDLLPHIEKSEHFRWQQFIKPGYFIPENKKIDDLLQDFKEKRVHMAIVVDEYGGTAGLITLEDIIEEIVGEINDEFDEENDLYTQVDETTYIFEGKTLLNDFCKILEVDPSVFNEVRGDSESVGGLLLELFTRLPKAGEKTKFDQFLFTIVSVNSKRIKRVKVILEPKQKVNFL